MTLPSTSSLIHPSHSLRIDAIALIWYPCSPPPPFSPSPLPSPTHTLMHAPRHTHTLMHPLAPCCHAYYRVLSWRQGWHDWGWRQRRGSIRGWSRMLLQNWGAAIKNSSGLTVRKECSLCIKSVLYMKESTCIPDEVYLLHLSYFALLIFLLALIIAVKSTKRQLAVVFNFIITVAAAFVFGYYCGKWFFSGDFVTVSHSWCGLALLHHAEGVLHILNLW